MPSKRDKYPHDWNDRARAVKEAAGWKCQQCGIAHMSDGTCGSILTVHHPDRDPANPDARLEADCARCHLADERRLRRAEKEKDQLRLF